jgi:hypothetical protein
MSSYIKKLNYRTKALYKSTASPKELLALVTNYPVLFAFRFAADNVTVG